MCAAQTGINWRGCSHVEMDPLLYTLPPHAGHVLEGKLMLLGFLVTWHAAKICFRLRKGTPDNSVNGLTRKLELCWPEASNSLARQASTSCTHDSIHLNELCSLLSNVAPAYCRSIFVFVLLTLRPVMSLSQHRGVHCRKDKVPVASV